MSYYEYRVVPAPKSLPKVKGQKSPEGRFAYAVSEALNAEGRDGWEFQRSETIEMPVKRGFMSKSRTETLGVLIFRRWVELADTASQSAAYPEPQTAEYAYTEERHGDQEGVHVQRVADPEDHTAPRMTAEPTFEPTRSGGLFARRDEPARQSVPPLRGPDRD